MNLREIKKDLEYVLGAFLDDCSVFATLNPKASDEELNKIFEESVDVYNSLKDKINVKSVEGSKRAYFNGLRNEILEKTDALYEKLSKLVKTSSK